MSRKSWHIFNNKNNKISDKLYEPAMTALTIHNFDKQVLVVGPTYNHLDKLHNLAKLSKTYDLVILNGNITYPNDGFINDRIKIISENQNVIYNLGNYDYQFISQENNTDVQKWLSNKPNVVIVNFTSQSNLIVTCGGIVPSMSKNSLSDNLEVSFVSNINGTPWHETYGGGFGYVISNNPLTTNSPKFYNFSCQLGNSYSTDTHVYAQEVDKYGLKRTFLV